MYQVRVSMALDVVLFVAGQKVKSAISLIRRPPNV